MMNNEKRIIRAAKTENSYWKYPCGVTHPSYYLKLFPLHEIHLLLLTLLELLKRVATRAATTTRETTTLTEEVDTFVIFDSFFTFENNRRKLFYENSTPEYINQ